MKKEWISEQNVYVTSCPSVNSIDILDRKQEKMKEDEEDLSAGMLINKCPHSSFKTGYQPLSAPPSGNSYTRHTGRILHKAEPTCCLLHFIQAHDDFLYVTTFAEELIDLFFCCIKGKISNIQCTAFLQ